MNKTISIKLSSTGVSAAIKELKSFKKDYLSKIDKFRAAIVQRIGQYAESGFNGASFGEYWRKDGTEESVKPAKVTITHETNGNISTVIATGEDAVWIEFGTGVYYNGAVGNSPHPSGVELGFTIGGYGKGNGAKRAWGYKNEAGELIITHGIPAQMPLLNAGMEIANELAGIAKEIFGD